jgi:hypothetical protein
VDNIAYQETLAKIMRNFVCPDCMVQVLIINDARNITECPRCKKEYRIICKIEPTGKQWFKYFKKPWRIENGNFRWKAQKPNLTEGSTQGNMCPKRTPKRARRIGQCRII